MKGPLSAKKEAAKPLTLEQAAAELTDLGISRDMLKAFAVGGRLTLYRLGAKRLVHRRALEAFRAWAEEKIAGDPDWLEGQAQRMRRRQGRGQHDDR